MKFKVGDKIQRVGRSDTVFLVIAEDDPLYRLLRIDLPPEFESGIGLSCSLHEIYMDTAYEIQEG